jgi:FixJ family two-component response regulator
VSREPLIAVIDDDEPFRMALVESLCSFGYRACGFASAEEFLAAGARTSCDCVITDIQMPGMSGFDLMRLLMARDWRVPVIMITARREPGLEARAAAGGAICLLRKPFGADDLMGHLKKALEV